MHLDPKSIYVIIAFVFILAICIRGMVKEFRRIRFTQCQDKAGYTALAELAQTFMEGAIEQGQYDYRNMQNWVGRWSDRVLKPKGVTLQGTYKHLLKEVVELGLELEKLAALGDSCDYYNDGDREELREKIAKELADIDIVTCHLAHQLRLVIATHFVEKMMINERRQWHAADADGVSQHVEGTDDGTQISND